MLRLASDADFNGDVIRALRDRKPDIDLVRVIDVGLRTAEDPQILEWAASHDRILLTHDENTMIAYARARIAAGCAMPGLFVAPQSLAIGRTADAVLLAVECSIQEEWRNRIEFIQNWVS
jgi:hypothetical protein